MSRYPYSQLHLGKTCTIVTAGPHVNILNSETGSLVASTTNLDDPEKEALLKSGPIRFSCTDEGFKHLVTVGDDKRLKVWQIEGLKILSERELPKKPTQIYLTRDGQTIIVSDKFGDVFSYSLHPGPTELNPIPTDKRSRGGIVSHENISGGTLILGHVSLVTTFLLTFDEKYIITADRDEHIRVSWHPQGYNIEMYCLGHRQFVCALHIPPFSPSILISAGGDPVIKIWDWMTGSLQRDIHVRDAVEPFIVVKGKKRKWMEAGDGGSGRRKGKRIRSKSEREGNGDDEAEVEKAEVDVELGEDDGVMGDSAAGGDSARQESEHVVLAIHKIDSLDLQQGRFLIFDAYGSTALFCCKYPSGDIPSSPENIHSLNFHKPVLNFIVRDASVWVLLDGEWGNVVDGIETANDQVKVVKWVPESEQFVHADRGCGHSALITALNSQHQISATPEELKKLDLYANLTSFPKNVDSSRDPMKEDIEEQAELAARVGKEMTIRELGRLKHKRALAAKLQKGDGGEGGEERETKKVKSDVELSDSEDEMND